MGRLIKLNRAEVVILLVFLLTPLRAITIFILPIVVLWIYYRIPLELWKPSWLYVLLGIFSISSVFGLLSETTSFLSACLSFVIFIPMFALQFCRPVCFIAKKQMQNMIVETFLYLLLLIDILGLWFWLHGGVDEYGTAYGRHYEYVHGLAMINTFVLLRYVMKISYGSMFRIDWLIAGFIAFSLVSCGYGLGMICLVLTLGIMLLLAGKMRSFLLLLILVVVVISLGNLRRFEYERQNVTKAIEGVDVRKLTMFDVFFQSMKKDPQLILIGTGPGGYNSRTAFLLCGDQGNAFNRFLGNIEPTYYKKDIYPLWNKSFVSKDDFTDGTRNKPYSNLVSFWAEQGVLFIVLYAILFLWQMIDLKKYNSQRELYHYIIALDIFMGLSLVSHLWFETTEMIVYCLIRMFMVGEMETKRRLKLLHICRINLLK